MRPALLAGIIAGFPELPAPGPVGTAFDPAGANANNVLSNSNRTVTNPSGASTTVVRSVLSVSAGKVVARFTFVATGSGAQIGLIDTTAALNGNGGTGLAGSTTAANKTFGLAADGNAYNGASFSSPGGIGALVAGDYVDLALDKGTNRLWLRKNGAGNWNASGTANPATGVGGWVVNAAITVAHLAAFCQSATSSITVDPDPPGKPSGFSGWTTGTPIDVLIVVGQSNVVAQQTDQSNDWNDPNVLTWRPTPAALVKYNPKPGGFTGQDFGNNTDKWAGELRYLQRKRAADPTRRAMVIRVPASGTQLFQSVNGTGTYDWNVASGELFTNAGYIVRDAMAALVALGYAPTINMLYWQQGEQDAFLGGSASSGYQANLEAIVAGWRNQAGDWKVPATAKIVIGRLSSQFGSATPRNQVRAAQKAVCDADVGGPQVLLNCDDLALEADFTHFTKASILTIGERLWQIEQGTYVEPTNTP